MRTSEFDYDLPPERIAQQPAEPRDSARLMVLDRAAGTIEHRLVRDLGDYLNAGDLVVANDSRVMPARLFGRKATSGGAVELLLLRQDDETTWRALVRGRVRPGTRLSFEGDHGVVLHGEVVEVLADGRLVRFDRPAEPLLEALGQLPLPPYITTPIVDAERYQTVYARVSGSAAAPTAGLHFTPDLIASLGQQGVGFAFVTLHIGLDTFRPVSAEYTADHVMHRELAELPGETARVVNATRRAGGRVVAVGTTAVRVLETAAGNRPDPDAAEILAFAGWTDLFISPGYRFRVVDALLTNFHFPRSSLLMLVSAYAGKSLIDRAYREALAGPYRFLSFGDAMLIR